MSGKPLKLKNFVEVKWTLVNDPSDKKSLAVRENRYMCAVTHDILSNAVPAAVIRTTYGLFINCSLTMMLNHVNSKFSFFF